MKLPKLPKSRPSSANTSPASTPRAHDLSPLSPSFSLRSPNSPNSSGKAPHKSLWPEKAKSLHLRLPSLPRTLSRSKRDFLAASNEPSPVALRSPLGLSNSNKNLLDNSIVTPLHIAAAASSSHASSSMAQSSNGFVEEITHVFEKLDTNGDGKISAEELSCMLRSLGDNTSTEEADLMVAEVDTDKDGFIDLQEFIDLNTRTVKGVNGDQRAMMVSNETEELAAAFSMFDLDKNGCITADELHCVLGNLGNRTSTLDDCKQMIRGVDRKGYGHVDFDDFKIMMTCNNTTIMA